MMITTRFEQTNGEEWTSLINGDEFLHLIAEETNSKLEIIGRSHLGANIFALTIGSGKRSLMFSGTVHGNEPAGREMLFIKARDYAYSTNPEIVQFLKDFKLVFVPTVNPDRIPSPLYPSGTRNNAQNVNINRGLYTLETPEGTALLKKLIEVDPDLYVDSHERSGAASGTDMELLPRMTFEPNANSWARLLGRNLYLRVLQDVRAKGFTAGQYPLEFIGRKSMTVVAGLLGIVEMVFETRHQHPDKFRRVNIQSHGFDSVLDWFKENNEKVKTFKKVIRNQTIKNSQKRTFNLVLGDDMYNTTTIKEIRVPSGYRIINTEIFKKWSDVYSIYVDKQGVVPVNQHSFPLIPFLLDKASEDAVVEAEPIYNGSNYYHKRDKWIPAVSKIFI